MPTVTIDAIDFETYADVDQADEYLAGDFGAALWRAETEVDQKARALVTGTRVLDRLLWGVDGVDDDEVPDRIVAATIVLAKLIHAGSKVDDEASTQTGIKREKAGSVEIEYFIPTSDPQRLPTAVAELIAPLLGGRAAIAGSIASGVCEPSPTWPSFYPTGPI